MATDHEVRGAQIVRSVEAASAVFSRLLGTVWRETERRLQRWVTEATATGSETAIIRATQAIRARDAMRAVLQEAGYDALVLSATDAPMTRLASQVLGTPVGEATASLGASGAATLEALKTLQAMDLIDEGEAVARELWSVLSRGLLGREPAAQLLEELGEVLDRSQAQIATLYDTSVSIFGRQVEALQAGDDPETKFLYAGPQDDLTREFCTERVGQVFTRADIDEMDNGQLSNVFLTGGGYNCRHVWLEVPA